MPIVIHYITTRNIGNDKFSNLDPAWRRLIAVETNVGLAVVISTVAVVDSISTFYAFFTDTTDDFV